MQSWEADSTLVSLNVCHLGQNLVVFVLKLKVNFCGPNLTFPILSRITVHQQDSALRGSSSSWILEKERHSMIRLLGQAP